MLFAVTKGASLGSALLGLAILVALGYGLYRLVKAILTRTRGEQPQRTRPPGPSDETKAAQKGLAVAQRDHKKQVRSATKALAKSKKVRQLASFEAGNAKLTDFKARRFVLYEDRIETPEGTHRLSPEVKATVDTAGNLATNSRVTLTRFALVGVFALAAPKKTSKDGRELYLLLEGPDWATTAQCNPDTGAKAREFVQAVNLAARTCEVNHRAKQGAVNEAEAALLRAKRSTEAIATAELRLASSQTSQLSIGPSASPGPRDL